MSHNGEHSSYPFKWLPVDDEVRQRRKPLYDKESPDGENVIVAQTDFNVIMPSTFLPLAEKIYRYEPRASDIWVVSYPKSGTTMTQELLWQVSHGVNPDAVKTRLDERSSYLEFSSVYPPNIYCPPYIQDGLAHATQMDSPRVIKTHLPIQFLPPNLLDVAKVVYVARNVKDVCVSYFHHYNVWKDFYGYNGDFDNYVNLFIRGELQYGDIFGHIKDAWQHRDHPRMKIVWYEDIKANMPKAIYELAEFAGYEVTQSDVSRLEHFLKIDNYRQAVTDSVEENMKSSMSKFFRKGTVGDWKQKLGANETEKKFNDWIKMNLEGTDIPMKFH